MNKIKELLSLAVSLSRPYSKALVVPATGVVLGLLSRLGITPEMTVQEAVALALGLVTALVWAIPNKK